MTPPVLTDEQREQARAAALRARTERSTLRALLRNGSASVADVLESTHDAYLRMPVRDVLRSLPGIGPVRAAQIMQDVGIAATRRVGGLSSRQRADVIALLATFGPGSTGSR
ncbi:MAG: hypothetical protein RLZZ163_1018 [Actinomycetota bacterium]